MKREIIRKRVLKTLREAQPAQRESAPVVAGRQRTVTLYA